MTEWLFHLHDSPFNGGAALHIARRREDGGLDVLTGATFQSIEPGAVAPESTPFDRPREAEAFLRAAMNCAWERGLRPDGFHDTRESMKATAAHLEDMRALAFHTIKATKPLSNRRRRA